MTPMAYELLGTSGLRVSEYALGTMTFGEQWGWGSSRETAAETFERYVEAGGNFIDTANNYTDGASERILGDLLADYGRDEFVVATKYTLATRDGDPNAAGNGRKNMFGSIEASLDRLATDYVDLLWVHAYDGVTPIEEVLRGLDDLVSSGRVHHVGLSDFPAWLAARAVTMADERGLATPCALQLRYNLADRTAERELLPLARALGLGVTAWSPLGGGLLTGKYVEGDANADADSDPDADAGDSRGRLDTTGQSVTDRDRRVAEAVVAVADAVDATPAQVALAWLDSREGQVVPIVGARTVAQLTENLAARTVVLDDDHLARLDEASAVDLGFPGEFLAQPFVRELIFGDTADRLRTR